MKKFIKKIYQALPFKKQIFSIIKSFYSPNENIYKHLHFDGEIVVKVDNNHSFRIKHYGYEIENSLFWAGLESGWEKISLSIWVKLARDADVILDIGANTGVYALAAKALKPDADIYAFEPVERVFDKLKINNQINSFDIFCIKKAVSDNDGKAVIYDTASEHTLSVTVNKNMTVGDAVVFPVEIETMKMSTFIEHHQIKKMDLIKIDVETHEVEALAGFGKYLSDFQPDLLIEILNDEVGIGIEKLIGDKNYMYFNIDDIKGTVRKVDRLTKSDYFNFLICRPETAKKLNLS